MRVIKKPQKEVWKPIDWIPEFLGRYHISNWGRVKSVIQNKILSERFLGGSDYPYVRFKNGPLTKYLRINRLVAIAFIENPHNYPQVNHKDENKSHNWSTNLEWCTAKQNCNHGTRGQRISDSMRSNLKHMEHMSKVALSMNKARSKPVFQFTKDGDFIRYYPSIHQVEKYGFDETCVGDVCKGKAKQHKGYIWEYVIRKPIS